MQSSNIVKTLYEDCVQAIRLVIPYLGGHDISSFKNIALRLRLWGSGLFGGSIGLDSLLSPSPDNPSLLRRSVIGTWADIALILEYLLYLHDSEARQELRVARSQLLVQLGTDEVAEESLEEPSFLASLSGNPMSAVDVVKKCGKQLEDLIDCLFDILPTIRRLRHIRLLQEELAELSKIPKEELSSALQAAAGQGNKRAVVTLLSRGAKVNERGKGERTALQAAAGGGYQAVVEILLNNGANVNAWAAGIGGRTALQAAAEGGHEEMVEILLRMKADVNAGPALESGRTALQAAAGRGHKTVVAILLNHGADVNQEPASESGRTALQAAVEEGHEEIIEILLRMRANVNAKPALESGRTALQAAAEGGHKEMVKILLGMGADVNASPGYKSGCTALQAAAGRGHQAVVEILLNYGADVNARAVEIGGRTALQAARDGGHYAISEILQDRELLTKYK